MSKENILHYPLAYAAPKRVKFNFKYPVPSFNVVLRQATESLMTEKVLLRAPVHVDKMVIRFAVLRAWFPVLEGFLSAGILVTIPLAISSLNPVSAAQYSVGLLGSAVALWIGMYGFIYLRSTVSRFLFYVSSFTILFESFHFISAVSM